MARGFIQPMNVSGRLFEFSIEQVRIKRLAFQMTWFYAINDQKTGPVSDSQLDELLSSGTINRDTLVWREGMAEWQPLKAVRSAGPPPFPGSQSSACAQGGRAFSPPAFMLLK